MRVVITTVGFNEAALAMLTEAGAEIRIIHQSESPQALADLLREFDPQAVISRSITITAEAIEAAPSLRAIVKTGVGVDNVDIDAATQHGVAVVSNMGANSQSVAEMALGLMFALARRIPQHDALLRAGVWSRFNFAAQELSGKHLGIVGYGQSGQRLAVMAQAIGLRVSVFAPRYRQGVPTGAIRAAASVAEMLREVDIISLHCPLTEATRNLINAESLATIRKGVLIINMARGGVIDEDALVAALESGQLGGAALDVHAKEPMPATHPLFAMNNVVLTPHVGGSTLQSAARANMQAAQSVLAVLRGEPLNPIMIANGEELAALGHAV
jgi:D-3-phosphoglycerate dehydrogenase